MTAPRKTLLSWKILARAIAKSYHVDQVAEKINYLSIKLY